MKKNIITEKYTTVQQTLKLMGAGTPGKVSRHDSVLNRLEKVPDYFHRRSRRIFADTLRARRKYYGKTYPDIAQRNQKIKIHTIYDYGNPANNTPNFNIW